jgi:hypothetical protein
VRHAGTTFALWQTCRSNRLDADASTTNRLRYATAYLCDRAEESQGALRINTGAEYKLGASALAVLTLLEAKQSTGDYPSDIVAGLINGITKQQRSDGSFTCYLDRSTGAALMRTSPYFPGEAIFALTRAWRVLDCAECRRAAERGLIYLQAAISRTDWSLLALQHWTIKAIAELGSGAVNHVDLLGSVDAAIDAWLEYEVAGWFPVSSSALATKAETLLASAAAWFRLGEQSRALNRFDRAVGVLLYALELQYGDDDPRLAGGFACSASRPAVRIDNVQHMISALLDYASLIQVAISR